MFNALLKKQLIQINTWLLQDKKKGTLRSKTSIVLLILLYLFIFGSVGGIFFAVAYGICKPLCALQLDWLYFAMMTLISVMLGVFGSVFNTFTTLYEAKDNEMLLSMPIPPSYILTVRILGVYFWSFIYTAIAFIPTLIVYLIYGNFSATVLVAGILLLIVISVFVLALSCVLGWVVAKISSRLKNKSFITVIASLAFIVIYYFFYFKATTILSAFLARAAAIGATVKGAVLPIYWLGKAGTGNFAYLLLIAAIVAVIMAVVFFVMSKSFIKMATSSSVSQKKMYVKEKSECKSISAALLGKELRRFASSANYMLNCGFGCLILPAMGVFAIIKADMVKKYVSAFGFSDGVILLALCGAMCIVASMNDITAPSISLEGKNLWIVKSLPVTAWQVLKAKINLHLLISEIPVFICAVCLGIALELSILSLLACIALPMLFVLLNAEFGLFVNLKTPNFTWTNEVEPIKQSLATFLGLFGGWVFVVALGALFFAVKSFISPYIYLIFCAVLIVALCVLLLKWLKNSGTKIFGTL